MEPDQCHAMSAAAGAADVDSSAGGAGATATRTCTVGIVYDHVMECHMRAGGF